MRPFISVIVPCFNHAQWLDELCHSYSLQVNNFTELIIIDDGSVDHTSAVAANWMLKDSRIKYCFKNNGGLSSARNLGIEKARGSIFHFIDADDLVISGCYQKIFDNFKAEDDVLITGYQYFKLTDKPMHKTIPSIGTVVFQSLLNGNFAPPAAHFVSRRVIEQIGLFDTTLHSAEDWDFWFRAALANFSFRVIPEVLIGYRYVPNSMSRNGFRMYEASKLVLKRYVHFNQQLHNYSTNSSNINHYLLRQLIRCLGVEIMNGKVNLSVEYFLKEIKNLEIEVSHQDFMGFSSYLSFKYHQEIPELIHLLSDVKEKFHDFFIKIDMNNSNIHKILNKIFTPIRYRLLKKRYGALIAYLFYRFSN